MTSLGTSGHSEAVFSIGSNIGDRKTSVEAGIEWLSGILEDFCASPVYATPDCHGGSREYLNAVAKGSTRLNPLQLEEMCKVFEWSCGRDSEAREKGKVPIDIDLVVYDGHVLRPKDFSCEFFRIGYSYM